MHMAVHPEEIEVRRRPNHHPPLSPLFCPVYEEEYVYISTGVYFRNTGATL